MGSATVLSLARMLAIEAKAVVGGTIVGDNLVLRRNDDTTFNAGNVKGPKGDNGAPGDPNDIVVSKAYGDGATDATAAIQAALDAATVPTGKGRVYIPEGTYLITSQLKIGSNTTLALSRKTTIKRNAGIDGMIINKGNGTSGGYDQARNILIEGGTWDANGTTHAGNCTVVAFAHAQKVAVQNTRITNLTGTWHMVEFNGVRDGLCDGVEFDNYFGATDATEMLQIDLMKNTSTFPWAGPYDNTPCDNIEVRNCLFRDSAACGIGTHSSTINFPQNNIVIRENKFTSLGPAVKAMDWTRVLVADNIMTNVKAGVIWGTSPSPAQDIKVSGNVIKCKAEGPDGRGIQVVATDSGSVRSVIGVIVENNLVREAGRYGIGIDFASDVLIQGNLVIGSGTWDSGSAEGRVGIWAYNTINTTIQGNRVRDTNPNGLAVGNLADIYVGATVGKTSDALIVGNSMTGALSIVSLVRGIVSQNIIGGTYNLTGTNAAVQRSSNFIAGTWTAA